MLKADLVTIAGIKSGIIELPKEIFGAKINPVLMAQAVRVYLSNQRQSHAKILRRGEIDLTKAKWYRQKGTGRARHGAQSAPIFVGGGKAHGPVGNQNYEMKMSKKMKKLALFSALTSMLKAKNIIFIKGLEKIEPKTKKMTKIIKSKKVMIVLPKVLENVIKAGRNIKGVSFAQASQLNTYQVLNQRQIIFTQESITKLKEVFLK